MSSDFKKYGAIDDGQYNVNFKNPGKTGSIKSNWALENTEYIPALDGVNPNPAATSKTHKNGVYVHKSNKNGGMLPMDKKGIVHPISTGCPIIVPSGHSQEGWNEFNTQLSGVKNYLLIINGRK